MIVGLYKSVPGMPTYFVSKTGKVKRIYQDGRQNAIKPVNTKRVKRIVISLRNHHKKSIDIGLMVAKAWISNPNGYDEIRYIDGDKRNTTVSNIQWVEPDQPDFYEKVDVVEDKLHNHHWKTIPLPKMEDVQLSIFGECRRKINGKYHQFGATMTEDGQAIYCYIFGKQSKVLLAALMALTFDIKKPSEDHKYIIHLDCNLKNNSLTNIAYSKITESEHTYIAKSKLRDDIERELAIKNINDKVGRIKFVD